MSIYQYYALKKNGSNCKGIIEADSERHARQILRERNLLPTNVYLIKKNITTNRKDKLNSQDLALLTRQLATLLSSGIPIDEALSGVSEQTENHTTKKLIIAVRAKLMEGYGLAQAMAEYPNAFPEIYRATIAAGEQTGNLDIVLEKLAEYTERQQKIKQKVQQALIYPSLMIIISLAIISFLLTFVVPKIIDVFTSSKQSLPIMTKILIKLSLFIQNYGIYFLIVLIIGLIIFKKSLKNIKILRNWHKLLLKIPLLSFFIKSINVARYIHTFGILFAAGVNVLDAMRVSSKLINNKIMQAAFDKAAIKVKEGTNIGLALKQTSYLTPMTIHLITSGEKSGSLSIMMERAAEHLDFEVKRLIDTGLTLLEPLIILIMGGVVLFIVLSTLLPIFSMEQLV